MSPELHVLVACGPAVCALPAAVVERLVREEDATTSEGDGADVVAVVRDREHTWPVFDLGALLGGPPSQGAFVLLRTTANGRSVRFALRTTRCLAVRVVPSCVPLPDAIFAGVARAIPAAFATAGLDVPVLARHGVVLDASVLVGARRLRALAEGGAS